MSDLNFRAVRHLAAGTALAAIGAMLLPAQAAAQSDDAPVTFSIEGSTRARVETIGGQFRPNRAESDTLVSFRTIVSAEAKIGAFTLGGEIYDARGYFQDDNSSARTGEVNALEPMQAYAAIDLGGVVTPGDKLRVKAGRYTLALGSGRLVGIPGFPNSINSYLGANAVWSSKNGNSLTVFWGKPFQRLPEDVPSILDNEVELDRANGNLTFFGAHATAAKVSGGLNIDAYVYRLAEHDAPGFATRDRRLVTVGARVWTKSAAGRVDVEVEGAGQFGDVRRSSSAADVTDVTVRAATLHAEVGYTIAGDWKPRIAAVFDYASGDDGGDRFGRFDPLYGARRADFGPTGLFGPVNRNNLVSPGVELSIAPSKMTDAALVLRGLWLDSETDAFGSTGVRDAAGASGRYAGTQIEGRVRRWIVPKRLRLEAGAAYLAKGGFLKDAPNAPSTGDTRYGYVDLTFSF